MEVVVVPVVFVVVVVVVDVVVLVAACFRLLRHWQSFLRVGACNMNKKDYQLSRTSERPEAGRRRRR